MDYLRKCPLAAACILLASCASSITPTAVVTTVQAWPSGGVLGARRRLRPPPSAANSVAADVRQCMQAAENRGVGIQLLVGGLDICLRKRAYLVDDPPRVSPAKPGYSNTE